MVGKIAYSCVRLHSDGINLPLEYAFDPPVARRFLLLKWNLTLSSPHPGHDISIIDPDLILTIPTFCSFPYVDDQALSLSKSILRVCSILPLRFLIIFVPDHIPNNLFFETILCILLDWLFLIWFLDDSLLSPLS